MNLLVFIFAVFIPIVIIISLISMCIIIDKSLKYRKEQTELYKKEKYMIEKQNDELKK